MAVAVEDLALDNDDHVVHFYADELDLAQTVGIYLSEAAGTGAVAIVIATEAHHRAFAGELERAGFDPEQECRDGTLIRLDAATTMAGFMPGGRVDGDEFREVVGTVVRQAVETGRPVRAYGEMVALLWDAGDILGAIELERAWGELGRELEFSLLCAYHSESVHGDEHADALRQVCHLHSSVLGAARGDRRAEPCSGATEVSAHFAAERDAPRCARQFVAEALGRSGHAGALLDDVQLLVAELATNAVMHARSPFSVVARAEKSRVRVSVRDASTVKPRLRHGDPTGTSGGRGLHLVAALSSDWGVEVTADGKTVWAELQT